MTTNTQTLDPNKMTLPTTGGGIGTWDKAGLALQTAGMMGNLINGLVQASQGRRALEIGTPFMGLGQVAGSIGEMQRKDAMRKSFQGMLGNSGLSNTQQGLLGSMALGDINKASEKAVEIMSKDPSMASLYMRSANGDPLATKAVDEYIRANPRYAPVGPVINMETSQTKNAARLSELEMKVNNGTATPAEKVEHTYMKNMSLKQENPFQQFFKDQAEKALNQQ